MKNTFLLILLVVPLLVYADFDYSAYQKETIEKAIENLEIDPRADYWIEAGEYKYETLAKFTGGRRPIIKETKILLEKWAKSLSLDITLSEVFIYEFEFEQNGTKYFIPIQEILIEPFNAEVIAGQKVSLYIMSCGAIKQRPIFIINEFKAQ